METKIDTKIWDLFSNKRFKKVFIAILILKGLDKNYVSEISRFTNLLNPEVYRELKKGTKHKIFISHYYQTKRYFEIDIDGFIKIWIKLLKNWESQMELIQQKTKMFFNIAKRKKIINKNEKEDIFKQLDKSFKDISDIEKLENIFDSKIFKEFFKNYIYIAAPFIDTDTSSLMELFLFKFFAYLDQYLSLPNTKRKCPTQLYNKLKEITNLTKGLINKNNLISNRILPLIVSIYKNKQKKIN